MKKSFCLTIAIIAMTLGINTSNAQVGIGTETPQSELDVIGHIRMADGNQKEGMLMISDSIGKASWKSIGSAFAHDTPVDFSCLSLESTTTINASSIELLYYEGYAYTISTAQLLQIDVSNPSLPVVVAEFNFSDDVEDIKIQDGYLYLMTLNNDTETLHFYTVDLSDPENITLLESYVKNDVYSGSIPHFEVGEDDAVYLAYIFDEFGNYQFAKFDISNPLSFQEVYDIELDNSDTVTHATFDVKGAFGFSGRVGFMYSFFLEDPNNILDTIQIDLGSSLKFAVEGDYLYVQGTNANKIGIFDVSDPSQLSQLSVINLPNQIKDINITGDYLYVTERFTKKLLIYDVRYPQSPVYITSIDMGPNVFHAQVVVNGNYAVVASNNNVDPHKLAILELSCTPPQGYNPLSGEIGLVPGFTLRETLETSNDAGGLQIQNLADPTSDQDAVTKAYVDTNDIRMLSDILTTGNDGGALQIKNISDPTDPQDATTKAYVDNSDQDEQTLDISNANLIISNGNSVNLGYHLINGNVGIGTETPMNILDINGSLAIGNGYAGSHAAPENGAIIKGSVGIGTETPMNMLDISGSMAIGSGYSGTQTAPANGAIIQGNVGIGTFNPTKGKLVIDGFQTYEPISFGYLDGNGETGIFFPGGPMTYSVYATHNISANEFHARSDQRIKNIQGITNSAEDLKTILEIEITDYHMQDTIVYGNRKFKKVIAQQVAEVYPQAVSTHLTEVIPDIYKRASIENDWIMLTTNLQIGERVKIISRDKSDVYAVIDVESDRFKVSGLNLSECKGDLPTVFIYGREVNDFHTVDYEAIAMLNVSATQGLAQVVLDQQKAIAALENKLAALEASLNIVPDRKINVIHDSPITSAASSVQNMPNQ